MVTEESVYWVEIYNRYQPFQAAGIPIFGPSLLDWPMMAVDVWQVLDVERQRADRLTS